MTPDEFFDKENGTTNALRPRGLSDDARNQLAELEGEADVPCSRCGEVMLRPHPFTGNFEFCLDQDNEEPVCEECYVDAYEEWADAQAEAKRESRLADQEAAFNMRWPR